jgi:large subunit ribosomal protein L24
MSKLNVKTGDTVVIISGKDRGKKGKVIEALPKKGKVIVEGAAFATKHTKPKKMGQAGGIVKQEAAIDASNVMHVCAHCGKATRVARKEMGDGSLSRYCKKCNSTLDG